MCPLTFDDLFQTNNQQPPQHPIQPCHEHPKCKAAGLRRRDDAFGIGVWRVSCEAVLLVARWEGKAPHWWRANFTTVVTYTYTLSSMPPCTCGAAWPELRGTTVHTPVSSHVAPLVHTVHTVHTTISGMWFQPSPQHSKPCCMPPSFPCILWRTRSLQPNPEHPPALFQAVINYGASVGHIPARIASLDGAGDHATAPCSVKPHIIGQASTCARAC